MGLGAEEARVRVRSLVEIPEKESDIAGVAKSVLETLLTMMGVAASIVPRAEPLVGQEEGAGAPVTLDINGDDLGILIGRRGHTLSCLQYIVRLMVGNQTEAWVPIIVDVEGYRQRRYEALRTLAWHMAEQVRAKGAPFTLEPMPAYERRVIHLALADNPDVITQSIGEGEARKVVILLKEDSISTTG